MLKEPVISIEAVAPLELNDFVFAFETAKVPISPVVDSDSVNVKLALSMANCLKSSGAIQSSSAKSSKGTTSR